jgi:NADPH:quinone reductase-like Zn-dependent oxidoreductase
MRAAVYERYGAADVVSIKDIQRPDIGADEILVRVHASAVTTADWRIRASAFPGYAWLMGRMMFGLTKPKRRVLGSDFAGHVVAKGANVTEFAQGDEVFGFTANGAHADYVAVDAGGAVVRKPASLSHEKAAAVPFGALAALVFLRDFGKLRAGQKVLINGASGGLGVFAVQLAKHFGAQVTGVASAENQDLLRALGADNTIDYRAEDFTKASARYDLIVDTVGKTRFRTAKRVLTPTGRYVPIEFGLREIRQALISRLIGGKRVVIGISSDTKADMQILADLLGSGAIMPVIDSRYPLNRIADAYRRVESRHKQGSVVLMVRPGGDLRLAA